MARWAKQLGILCGLYAALALVACGSTGSSSDPSRPSESETASGPLQEVIDAAREEGRLNLVWGEGTVGGSDGTPRIIEGFKEEYGLEDLDVQFTTGPSMPQMASQIAQEYEAGRPSTSDVSIGTTTHMSQLMELGVLEEIDDWDEWAPNLQKYPEAVHGNGAAISYEGGVVVIAYNSNQVDENSVPRTLEELLKPEYKGRIASTGYAASFNYLASDEIWGPERTLEYVEEFSNQVAGLIRCSEVNRLATGEFDIFALTCDHTDALEVQAQGAPVDFVVPEDAPLIVHHYAAVPKNAEHPNAAKLFLNYLLNPETQDIMYETGKADSTYIEGSETKTLIDEYEQRGVEFYEVDIAFLERSNPDMMAQLEADMQEALRR